MTVDLPLIALAITLVIQTVGIGYWAGKIKASIDELGRRLDETVTRIEHLEEQKCRA